MSQMMPYPPGMVPPPPPRRTGSLGCLGVFSFFCLLVFTLAEVAVLLRMDPSWFDRLAFWRGPIREPDVILVSGPGAASDGSPSLPPPPAPAPQRNAEEQIIPFRFAMAGADYVPSQGAVLALADGARVQLPPGSVREAAEVTIAPVLSLPPTMAGPLAGSVYEFRVGAAEHYQFSTPVRVTFPYDPRTKSQPFVAVWEGTAGRGRWVPARSWVDPATRTVTADLPHASLWGVFAGAFTAPLSGPAIAGGLAVGTAGSLFFALTGGGRSIAFTAWRFSSASMTTSNFKIHYYTQGTDAVPDDATYAAVRPPGMPGVPGRHPLYVQDLGTLLEQSRDELKKMGYPITAAGFIHWDVFLCHMSKFPDSPGEPGKTYLSGPMFLSSRMHQMGGPDCPVAAVMRSTCAHEAVHLAQSAWVWSDTVSGTKYSAFIETTGAYLGDLTWERLGSPTNVVPFYYMSNAYGLLPTKSWDQTEDPEHYAYGSFFRFLDAAHAKTAGLLIESVAGSKDPSLAGIDAQVQALPAYGDRTLADLFTEYAQAYYHDDFWGGDLYPRVHKAAVLADVLRQQSNLADFSGGASSQDDFVFVSQAANATTKTQKIVAAGTAAIPAMPHLTAHAAYFWFAPLPKERKAKLVVTVTPPAPRPAWVRLYVARDRLAGTRPGPLGFPVLPAAGSPARFEEVERDAQAGGWRVVIDQVGAADGPNLVTLIGVNRSLDRDLPGYRIDRRLLLAPAWVEAKRDPAAAAAPFGAYRWTVSWHESELKTAAGGAAAFRGYNVYRKPADAPDAAFALVKRGVQEETYTDRAPDGGTYVYTVRVEEASGVESDNAPYVQDDFVGTWEGEVQLVDGSLAAPFIAAFEKSGDEADAKNVAEIAKIEDPELRARRKAEYDKAKAAGKQLWGSIKELLEAAEILARIGIPIEVEIKDEPDGGYAMVPRKLAYQPIKQTERIKMRREAAGTLRFLQTPKEFPPAFLRLHRADREKKVFEIRETGYSFTATIDGKPYKCTWKWVLKKKVEERG